MWKLSHDLTHELILFFIFHIEGRFFGHRRRPTMVGRAAASHSAVSANNQQQNSRKEQNGPMAQRHNAESFEAWRKNVLASSNDDPRGREAFASLMLAVAPIE